MLSDRHLEVGKNGDGIVVRLGKHQVLDELTVNKISDELLGVADWPDCHRLLLDFSGVAQLSSAMLAQLVPVKQLLRVFCDNRRVDGVVPLRTDRVADKPDGFEFGVTDALAGFISLFKLCRRHFEPGLRRGAADES